jgi:superfamily II DNA or RNA helicase
MAQLNLPILQQLLQEALEQVKTLRTQLEAEQAKTLLLQEAILALEDENSRLEELIHSLSKSTGADHAATYKPRTEGVNEPTAPSKLLPVGRPSKNQTLPIERPAAASNTKIATISTANPVTPEEKIALFRGLFAGRQDIYAVRWEDEVSGRSGYQTKRQHDYATHIYDKKKLKSVCNGCPDLPLTNDILKYHLQGKQTIGVYPLLRDDTCSFLVIDLDEKNKKKFSQNSRKTKPWLDDDQLQPEHETSAGTQAPEQSEAAANLNLWQKEASSLIEAASKLNIPAYLERSRSGNGGHIWIFFSRPVLAAKARRLGEALITKACREQGQLSLSTYDRMFPSQDTQPKLEYGNLIALPLQKGPLSNGNSAFLDANLEPLPDQWKFLASVQKLEPSALEKIVGTATRQNALMIVPRPSYGEETSDLTDPWAIPPSGEVKKDTLFVSPPPTNITITLGNLAYIAKEGLTGSQLNCIERIAAFQNPQFYRNQALRISNYNTPRIISCAEEFPMHLALPRGCLDDLTQLLQASNAKFKIDDCRFLGKKIKAKFTGKLRAQQIDAAKELLKHDTGVLSATTAFGKTVLAAYCISKRKVNTLIVVHRQQLLRQWKQKLESFLDLPADSIGQIGGGKHKPSGVIDIATIQSLRTKDGVSDLVANYGQVIVDECHIIGAVSFEQVLRQVKAKFVLGLTATPVREDGHHPIVVMQCGPIRYKAQQNNSGIKEYVLIPKATSTMLPSFAEDFNTQAILSYLTLEESRNRLIVDDIIKAVSEKRSPLVLTKRTEHLKVLLEMLQGKVKNIVVFQGGLGNKQQNQLAEKLASIPEDEERVVLATGQAIGEGFDDARLDTLFLAMPISWSGTLAQYAGRLHRFNEGKSVVQIYDYVDVNIDKLYRMFNKRQAGYKKIGYKMQSLLQNETANANSNKEKG